ncbi:hypothetical protein DSO57_1014896 [Entomophthora muscae]|uniref:Uncharacterized protein n=1 Tax=Entomophthora muscae TaxID=34485 RepID=A0ACC2SIQ7_9FUNG|nr:hypothetical protein DSO57_1014896 [Entomophthora muscae]
MDKTIFQTCVGELDNIRNTETNQPKALITAPPKIPIKDVLTLMAKNNILCLPIQSHQDANRVVNLVNLFDILTYLVQEVSKSVGNISQSQKPDIHWRRTLDSSTMLSPEIYRKLKEPIENVMTLDSERESYRLFTCSISDTLKKVISAFGSGIHRAVVLDSEGNPKHILTQMDIVRHLNAHPELLPAEIDTKKDLMELGLYSKKNITFVDENTATISAYRQMADNRFTSLVVIDSQSGKVISNLSASSLRGLNSNNLEQILLPVKRFMKESPRGLRPLVFCPSTYKFWELIVALVTKNSHHAWLVDDNHKPCSSISPTDIFRLVASCK